MVVKRRIAVVQHVMFHEIPAQRGRQQIQGVEVVAGTQLGPQLTHGVFTIFIARQRGIHRRNRAVQFFTTPRLALRLALIAAVQRDDQPTSLSR